MFSHVFFDVIHEIFNTVFVFQLTFDLELLEYLEDDFSFFFHWFSGVGLTGLFFAANFHQEVVVEISFDVFWKGNKLWEIFKIVEKFLFRCLFSHLECFSLEVMLYETFYQLMLFLNLFHEMFKNFMRGGSLLTGIEHSLNSFWILIFG